MKLKIVNANLNRGVNALTGEVGTSYRLRAQFDEITPRGVTFEWVLSPSDCLVNAGKVFKPDYKREWVSAKQGTVHVVARAKDGSVLALSQVVKVELATNDGGA